MATVYLDNPTNSTMFTTCCQVAICGDQEKCPLCREEVTPFGDMARWSKAYGPIRRGEKSYGRYGY